MQAKGCGQIPGAHVTPTPQTRPFAAQWEAVGRWHFGRAATVRRIWSVTSVSMMPGRQYDRVVGKES
jgi:hypothetical protein